VLCICIYMRFCITGGVEGSVSLLLSYIYMRFVMFFVRLFSLNVLYTNIYVCVCAILYDGWRRGQRGSSLFFHMYVCVS